MSRIMLFHLCFIDKVKWAVFDWGMTEIKTCPSNHQMTDLGFKGYRLVAWVLRLLN